MRASRTTSEAAACAAAPVALRSRCVYIGLPWVLRHEGGLEIEDGASDQDSLRSINSKEAFCKSIPFEAPVSISELALLPRIPRLLRRCLLPPPPVALFLLFCIRISLFRRRTGVSAKGRLIFCGLGSRGVRGTGLWGCG